MKIMTVCGSLKFESEIRCWTEILTLEGNCVLSIVYPTKKDKDAYTSQQRDIFGAAHKKRIELSEAIFVVNKNGYIGSTTKSEIEYAKALRKEILFLE